MSPSAISQEIIAPTNVTHCHHLGSKLPQLMAHNNNQTILQKKQDNNNKQRQNKDLKFFKNND